MVTGSRQLGLRLAVAAVLIGATAAAILSPAVREPLSAVLAIIVGAAAVAYALITERLLEAQTRPYIILTTVPHQHLLYLVVQNTGAGEAYDVRFSSEGDFTAFPDQMVTGARFIRNGFKYLAPGQQHGVLLANLASTLKEEASVEITVTYRSRHGRNYDAVFPFHLQE